MMTGMDTSPLTRGVTDALLAVAKGDGRDADDARMRLARGFDGLILRFANRYGRVNRVDPDGLMSAGYEGALEGIAKFDAARGTQLSTLVYFYVRKHVQREAWASSPRNVSKYRIRLVGAYRRAAERLATTSGVMPTDAEVIRELGWRPCRVAFYRRGKTAVTYRDPAHLADVAASPRSAPRLDIAEEVASLLRLVCPTERRILALYYGLDGESPRSLNEVGRELGFSKNRASKIHVKAIERIRRNAPLTTDV